MSGKQQNSPSQTGKQPIAPKVSLVERVLLRQTLEEIRKVWGEPTRVEKSDRSDIWSYEELGADGM